jgi:hypothetical protein
LGTNKRKGISQGKGDQRKELGTNKRKGIESREETAEQPVA